MATIALVVLGGNGVQKGDTLPTPNTAGLRDNLGGMANVNETITGSLINQGSEVQAANVQTGASYTIAATDRVVECNPAGAMTVTLPAAASSSGRVLEIFNASTHTITIGVPDTATINGASTKALSAQYTSVWLYCDGTNWLCRTTTS